MHRALLVLPLALTLTACRHVPDARQRETATNYYELGLQALQSGDPATAYKELGKSIELAPDFAPAHNVMGVLLHMSFRRLDEAAVSLRKAIELDPQFSEAHTHLGNLFMDQERYDEAIAQYQLALDNLGYATPYIAQGNMGWALYRKGELEKALSTIKTAVTNNPRYCLGYLHLGVIHDAQDDLKEALRQFTRYREACPDTGDAYLREGLTQAKLGMAGAARDSFSRCEEKASTADLKDQCHSLAEKLK